MARTRNGGSIALVTEFLGSFRSYLEFGLRFAISPEHPRLPKAPQKAYSGFCFRTRKSAFRGVSGIRTGNLGWAEAGRERGAAAEIDSSR